MNNKRNYYRILFIQPDAPTEVIRASYRIVMQKLRQHPDLGGEHWNACVINEALNVLTDVRKRRIYDRELFNKKDHAALRKQHPQQRMGRAAAKLNDNGWRPFEPTVLY